MMSKAITESLITHESTRGFGKLANLTDFVVICLSGFDEALPDGVTHQIRGLVEVQLIHNAGAVAVGCLDAHAQTRGDFLGGISFGYKRDCLPLWVGQF